MAKIGGVEIDDAALEKFFKEQGRRVVDESDYIKKSEAANDLAKWRAVTGDDRSIDEIGELIKKQEEADRKNKSDAELLKAELDKIKEARKEEMKELKQLKSKERERAIKDYFGAVAQKEGFKIIEPILEKHRKEFMSVDDSKMSQDELTAKVKEALGKAHQEQVDSLKSLGIGSDAEDATPFSSGGGFYQRPEPGRPIDGNMSPDDAWRAISETSSSGRTPGFPASDMTPQPRK